MGKLTNLAFSNKTLLITFAAVFAVSFVLGAYITSVRVTPAEVLTEQSSQNSSTSSPASTPASTPFITPSPLPLQKQLSGGTHVFQTFNNCGPASLSMALSYYQITATQQSLGQALRPYQNSQGNNDDKSVTLQELAAKAEEYGLTAYHRPAGSMELIQAFVANDIPVITRTWLHPGEDIGHYRVVVGYDQTQQILIQDDSLQGNDLQYTYQGFNELWQAFNYEFLVLVPANKKEQAEVILGPLLDEKTAWEKAKALAVSQSQNDPLDIYAVFNLSVAEYQLGDVLSSIAAFELVEGRLPSRMLWYQIDPILAYYKNGDFDRVLQMTQRILENNNRAFSELHYLRALIFEARGQTDQANQAFQLVDEYNQEKYWQVNLDELVQ